MSNIYIYIYIYIHTHIYTHIYKIYSVVIITGIKLINTVIEHLETKERKKSHHPDTTFLVYVFIYIFFLCVLFDGCNHSIYTVFMRI